MKKIGFIGLGLMGQGMACNLLQKGFLLSIRGRSSRSGVERLVALGAREAPSYAGVARESDIVFICVTGTPQVEEIVYGRDGIMEAARDGLIVVDTSTSEPDSTNRIRADLAARGTRFVDAPLARTPKEAEEGRLNTMVGADPATFAEIEPVMRAFCENIFHIGAPGTGHVIKLINNFMAMSIAASTAEALAASAKAGIDLGKLHQLISAGGVSSGIFQMMVTKMLEGDLTGMKFSIVNAQKDLRYYTHMTESMNLPSFVAEAVHQSFTQAVVLGCGDKFIPSLAEAQEKLNGISIVPRA